MYQIIAFLTILCASVQSASYQRYGDNTQYSTYSSYSTVSNSYSQNPYKTGAGSYGTGDISNYPTQRYPSSGYSTNKYDSYTTPRSNALYPPGGYSTQRYGDSYSGGYGQGYGSSYGSSNYGLPSYGSSNYGSSNYGSPNYGSTNYGSSNYGSSNYAPGFGTGYNNGFSTYEMPFMTDSRGYCVNRAPQTSIWVDNLMGMWYGVEFIEHLAGDSRIDYTRTCIVVHVSEPVEQPSTENQLYHVQHINAKFRQEYRHLRLLWDEAGKTIEYSLYFRNDSAGYWQVLDGQNGTMTSMSKYRQFAGTIQVLKAVSDHLVLNFCQEATSGRPAQLYSVLFSREPGVLEKWEMESVHTLLQNKKLSIASRRMVCGNSADRPLVGVVSSLIMCLLAYTIGLS